MYETILRGKDYELIKTTEGIGIIVVAMLETALNEPCNQLRAAMASHPDDYELVTNEKTWIRKNRKKRRKPPSNGKQNYRPGESG